MAFGMKKSVAAVFSVLLLSGSIVAGGQPAVDTGANADSSLMQSAGKFISNNPGTAAAMFALLLAELRFQTKDTDRLPCRYDLNKFKTGEANWQDVWHVVDDGLIGQQFKSDSVKPGEDGKIVVTAFKPAKGILGYIHSYWVPVVQACGVTFFAYEFAQLLSLGDVEKIKKALEAKTSTFGAAFIAMLLTGKYCSYEAPSSNSSRAAQSQVKDAKDTSAQAKTA